MLNKVFKFIGIDKVHNVLDLFVLSGTVKNRFRIDDRNDYIVLFSLFLFISILIFGIFFVELISTRRYILIFSIFILVSGFIYADAFNENKNKLKFFKKIIKKKFDVSLKDEEFKQFLETNFNYIRSKKLSNKETIKLINDWKENEDKINEDRKEEDKEKNLKEIKNLKDKIKELEKEV